MKRRGKSDRVSGRNPRSPGPQLMLVPLSCPDCAGVLSLAKEGPGARRLYVCQIDHRHSITSLYRAMEERLENTLWTAIVIMRQIDHVYEDLLAEKVRPTDSAAKNVRRRLHELKEQRAALRAVIKETHVIESAR